MDAQTAQLIEEEMAKEEYQSALDKLKAVPVAEYTEQDVFNMAICKTATGDLNGAILDLLGLHRNGSNFPYLHYMLGQLYEKSGDIPKAIFYYRKGMQYRETYDEAKIAYDFLRTQKELDEESARIIELKPFKSDITFKDVVGLDAIKKQLFAKVILPLRNPAIFKEYGRGISTGIILYGPTGTGKTLLARAIAGETNAYMIIVKIHQVEGEFVGISEKNVAKVFEQARINAPCIIFIDEFEVLGGKRSSYGGSDEHGGTSVLRNMCNALLEELDGIEKNPEGIMVVTATNRPFDIDTALKRPGRLETSIYVPAPTYIERLASFKLYLGKMKIANHINYPRLARATEGNTHADIRKICNEAAEIPIIEHSKNGIIRNIKMKDVLKAIPKVNPSLDAWFMEARKELIGRYNMDVIDGKPHYTWRSANLEPQEMAEYKDMIKDVMHNTDPAVIRNRKINRFLALHFW